MSKSELGQGAQWVQAGLACDVLSIWPVEMYHRSGPVFLPKVKVIFCCCCWRRVYLKGNLTMRRGVTQKEGDLSCAGSHSQEAGTPSKSPTWVWGLSAWAFSAVLPVILAGSWIRSWTVGAPTQTPKIGCLCVISGSFMCCATVPALQMDISEYWESVCFPVCLAWLCGFGCLSLRPAHSCVSPCLLHCHYLALPPLMFQPAAPVSLALSSAQLSLTVFLFFLTFALFIWKKKEREREICWFTLQMTTIVGSGPVRIQELHLGSLCGCRGPSSWAIFLCYSRCISRKLGWNGSSWDSMGAHVGCWLYSCSLVCCASMPASPSFWCLWKSLGQVIYCLLGGLLERFLLFCSAM